MHDMLYDSGPSDSGDVKQNSLTIQGRIQDFEKGSTSLENDWSSHPSMEKKNKKIIPKGVLTPLDPPLPLMVTERQIKLS